MTNPFYDPYAVLTKVYSAGAHLKIALAETPIEDLNRARTVKTVYGVLEHDRYLSYCIRSCCGKTPKSAVRTVLKIALYFLIYLEKPRYMVTDTAVDLLKKLGKGGAAGFANAFLRRFDPSAVLLPAGDEGLEIESNFPLFAIRMLREAYGERAKDVVLAKSHGVAVRFVRGEERYLSRPHEDTPFDHLYIFPNFTRDEGFDRGDYTFQSMGSVAVCSVVERHKELLDACAAPGGKSVLLSQTCGHVTACDVHAHRVALIESYARRMGADNVTAAQADSTAFCPDLAGRFDGVLCDAPCSGLGTVAENPDLALVKREEDLKGLNETQLKLLKNCARYLKEGGALYYSTCSLLPCENEDVVSAFLQSEPDFCEEAADCPLPHEKRAHGLQFLPDRAYGAGFYVAKMRKKR